MSCEERLALIIISIVLILAIVFSIGFTVSPSFRAFMRGVEYNVQKADDATSYSTRKQVEDTCRSLIVSYEADRLYYEQYITSTNDEERSWASLAKARANKAALQYNEFILKNSFVWESNVPPDINAELKVLE